MECSGCQLIRLYPWPNPAELGSYYPQSYWFASGVNAASRFEELYRRFVLRDHVGFVRGALDSMETSGPVLDVGCGGGLFPRLLSARWAR